jgi:hypothetical protein
MRNNYIVLLFILAIAGIVAIKKYSQTTIDIPILNSTVSANHFAAKNENKFDEIYERRMTDRTTGSTETSTIVESNLPTLKYPAETAINSPDKGIPELEPTEENASLTTTNEHSDEINLPIRESDCTAPCDAANNTNINAPATGEFADQINADAIFAQAQQKNPDMELEAKLIEVPTNSSPPTEPGVYSPPQ